MRAGPLPPPRPSPPRPKLTAGDKQQGGIIKWSQLSGTALVGQQGRAIAHHPQRPPRDGRPRSACRGVSSPHSRSPSLGTPHEGGSEQGMGRYPLRWEDVPRVHHSHEGANGERPGRSGAPGPGARGHRCSATVTAWGPLATTPGEGPGCSLGQPSHESLGGKGPVSEDARPGWAPGSGGGVAPDTWSTGHTPEHSVCPTRCFFQVNHSGFPVPLASDQMDKKRRQ